MIATTPVIAFWAIGDQSLPGDENDLDYLVRLSVSTTTIVTIGLASTLIFATGAAHLVVNRRPSPNPRATQLVALLMLVGLLLAFGCRILTAGVIGANIGGGLFVMFGLPLCAGLVSVGVVRCVRSARSPASKPTVRDP